MKLSAADVLRSGWMLDPAGFGRELTRGRYRIPPWIDHVSRIVATETVKGGARILISCPPQHGKSLLMSGLYPLWRVALDPSRRVGVVSYGEELAARSVRYGRDMAREHSQRLGITIGKSTEDHWEIVARDGIPPGYVRAMGIRGAITGYGFTDLVLDDPYASLEEALSETIRAKVAQAYWSTLMTRLARGANLLGIMTRWTANDIFAEIIASGGVREIRLPALAEENDPLGRKPGEALWEELHPRAELEALREKMPPAIWSAMYQGRPVQESGGMFRRRWIEDNVIEERPALVSQRTRYWDPAASRQQRAGDPDFAVGVLASRIRSGPYDRRYCVEEIDRDRGTALDLERRIVAAARRDGRSVRVRIEEEPGSLGGAYVAHLVQLLAGHDVRGVKHGAGADKGARARPFAAQMEIGNVVWVKGPWLAQAVREFELFVGDGSEDHDDVVDAATGAFEDLAGAARWPWESAALSRAETARKTPDDRIPTEPVSPFDHHDFRRAMQSIAVDRGGRHR